MVRCLDRLKREIEQGHHPTFFLAHVLRNTKGRLDGKLNVTVSGYRPILVCALAEAYEETDILAEAYHRRFIDNMPESLKRIVWGESGGRERQCKGTAL